MKTPRGLPTASRLELALTCAASQALGGVDTAWAAGGKGTDKHAALAHWIDPAPVAPASSDEAAGWLRDIYDDAETVAPLRGSRAEVSLAWDHTTGAGRDLGARLGRAYSMARPAEYVGTADYVRVEDGVVMVADLKTGQAETTHPARNAQLRMLALAACRAYGVERARIGILWAPEGRQPRWQWADMDAFDLEETAGKLRQLAQRIEYARRDASKDKAPWLTVGEHCDWCPARFACPARVGMAKAMANNPEGYALTLKHGLDDDNLAAMALARWQAARKILNDVGDALHARAKERPIPLEDGRVWGPVTTTREEIDAERARPVLEALLGAEGALKAMTLDTSKAGIERGVKAAKSAGAWKGTIKAGVEASLEAVRSAGAVTSKERTEYQEHAPALPAGS